MKILITGANGQLGSKVVSLLNGLKDRDIEIQPFSRSELNVGNKEEVFSKVGAVKPDWILHCAAFTKVEAAEDEERQTNWEINKDGSSYISEAAAECGSNLIFISTDYVFDGEKEELYSTEDATNPINQYGEAKLAGEKEVLKNLPCAHIIRTSWVFGENGKNFVYTMLNLAKKLDTLKVVNDQYGRPTYTHDLAEFMIYIINHEIGGGIYHFSNDGQATWFEFAKEILKNEEVEIIPVSSEEFPQKAKRPKHSIMSLESVKNTGFTIPSWKNALDRFMKNR